ncbi:MAG: hypothetical protein ACOC2W_01790 [bacterium]
MWEDMLKEYLENSEVKEEKDIKAIMKDYFNEVFFSEAIYTKAEIEKLKDPELRPWMDRKGYNTIYHQMSDEDKKKVKKLGKMAQDISKNKKDLDYTKDDILNAVDKLFKK